MTLAPELVDLFKHNVTYERYVSKDRYNKYVYAAPVTLRAHVEESAKMVRAQDGVDRVSNSQIWMEYPDAGDVQFNDRLTLPNGKQPPIMSVENWDDDLAQPYYVKVYT